MLELKKLFDTKTLKEFRDRQVIVKAAEEPTNIKWENAEFSENKIKCWKYLSWLIIIIILFTAFCIYYSIHIIKVEMPSINECNKLARQN